MRWRTGNRSSNVEDQRGQTTQSIAGTGMLMRFLPRLLGTKSGRTILGIGVLVFIGAKFLGIDLMPLLSGGQPQGMFGQSSPSKPNAEENELADFVSVVLADTETTWHAQFKDLGEIYKEPKLVLFSDSVNSACGQAGATMGPFYCPADQKIYIDLSFYRDLKNRHNAPGDFAQAYVIAHEVGHHVQNLLGASSKIRELQAKLPEKRANALSVKLELQADCFAGLWAHSANLERNILEEGDLEEAIAAASAIGDDRLQKQAQGYAVPESFTHGTSEQRVKWFKAGFTTGDLRRCNTFGGHGL